MVLPASAGHLIVPWTLASWLGFLGVNAGGVSDDRARCKIRAERAVSDCIEPFLEMGKRLPFG